MAKRNIIQNNRATPGAIVAAERQRDALEMRKAGCTFRQIADKLGYAGHQGAYEAVRKAIEAIPREAACEVRQMEIDRLNRMQLGIYDKAVKGDHKSIDRMLRIMERRAKLLGLDAPTQILTDPAADTAEPRPRITIPGLNAPDGRNGRNGHG